jgi:hypothetical protein
MIHTTTNNNAVMTDLTAAIAQSTLVPLFTVASPHPQALGLAPALEGRGNATPAKAPGDRVVGSYSDSRQLTPDNCAPFIKALLAQFPAESLTVTSDGSQATIAATPAMYESLERFWLTAEGLEESKPTGLNADALGQAAKPFSPLEMLACLNAIFQHKASKEAKDSKLTSDHLLKFGAIAMDDERRVVTVSGAPVELRPMDYKLLRFLISHPERVFSRRQLLDKVWGGHAFVEERTVDTHVMNLRKSLGQCSHYVKTVHSVGYVLKNG